LIRLVEEGQESDSLSNSLNKVLASLDDTGGKTSVQRLRDSGSFGSYENMVTRKEAISPGDRVEIVSKLQAVIRPRSPEQRRDSAIAAIPFFDAIERRALYHYNHPQVDRRATVVR